MLGRVPHRADKLRQQMISESKQRSKGALPMNSQDYNAAQHPDGPSDAEIARRLEENILADKEAPITIDNEEPAEAEEPSAPSISDVFAQKGSVRLSIVPRIMLNITARDSGDAPNVVKIDGEHYSVSSPLRKGTGEKSSPSGLIRDSLSELATYVGKMSERDVIFFGDTEGLEDRVNDLMQFFDQNARAIMYGMFDDTSNPHFQFLSSVAPVASTNGDDEDDDGLDSIGVTEYSAAQLPETMHTPVSDAFEVHTWPVFDIEGDGTVILRPTIAINVNVPLLVGVSDMVKPLKSMSKIVANYSRTAGMAEDDFRLTFAFDSSNLLDEGLLNLLYNYATEDSEAAVLSTSYLRECAQDIESDVYRIFPTGRTAIEAEHLLLSNGGDTLLML